MPGGYGEGTHVPRAHEVAQPVARTGQCGASCRRRSFAMKDHDHNESANGMAAASAREHQQAWESLPWLANGTASAEQRFHAVAHLAECADCRRELEVQQRLQQAMVDAQPQSDADADADADAEAGLQRMLERLDAPAMEQPLPSPHAMAPHRQASWLTLALTAAAVVQAIGLGVL